MQYGYAATCIDLYPLSQNFELERRLGWLRQLKCSFNLQDVKALQSQRVPNEFLK